MIEVQAAIRQLGEEHPEWKGMRWSALLHIDTDRQSEFRIRIIDPNGFDKKPVVWAVIVVAIFAVMYTM